MATQNINIVISSTGGVTVIRNLQQIGQAATNALNPLRLLQAQINAVMGALAIHQIMDWADEWTAAANKVSVFSKSQEEANQVLDRLYNLAQSVGQPLNSVVDLYHKLSIQAKALGASVEDNIRVTDIVSKALTIQGTSAQAAHGALLQLSQSFGTGKVKAQEYNSLLTGMPLLLKVVADNLDKAGGSIAKLTALQRSGQLSSKEFFDAILRSGVDIDKIFGNMNKTFSQGLNVLTNGLRKFFGELNASLGISNEFFKFTTFLAENLQTIVRLLGIVAATVVGAFAPAIIGAFAGALGTAAIALGRITALLLTNPFALIAAAVASVIAFGDSWDAGIDSLTTVKDVFGALMQDIGGAIDTLSWAMGGFWKDLVNLAQTAYKDITNDTDKSVGSWSDSYTSFFDDTGNGFFGLLRKIAKVTDAIAGLITGLVIAIGKIFAGLPNVIENIFNAIYNIIANIMEGSINTVIGGINKIREISGGALIDAVSFEKKAINTKVFQEYGATIASSIDEGFAIQGGYMVKQIDALEEKAQMYGVRRRADAFAAKKAADLAQRGTPDPVVEKAKKGKKEKEDHSLEKLQNQLRTLLDRIDPAAGALLEMAKAEDILNKAVERGLISGSDRERYLVALKEHYRDIIDPLGAYNKKLLDEASVSGLSSRARSVEVELMKLQEDMRKRAQPLTEAQIAQERQMLEIQQKLNEQMQIRDQLQAGSKFEADRKFSMEISEMQKLIANPTKNFNKADAQTELQKQMPQLFADTQEAIDLNVKRYQDMYTKIDQMLQASLISEQTASQMKQKVWAMEVEQKLKFASDFFGTLAGLSSSSNSKLAAIGKAAAITQATIKGFVAVQEALASGPPPYNYAMAAAVGIAAAANVAKIIATPTGFATGGDFRVGGSGGVDSQMVAFRASPGERVNVSTPTQVRKGSATKDVSTQAQASQPNLRVINVLDPNMIGDYLDTPEGSQVMINHIRKNADSVRQAINNG